MQIAVCVPEGEYGVAVMSVAYHGILEALHHGVLAVDVAEQIRVNQGMVQAGVEHCLVAVRPAAYLYASEVGVPSVVCVAAYLVESQLALFLVKILTGVGHGNE